MYEHTKSQIEVNMRKPNYDKYPSTKITGMIAQGWDTIITILKEKMNGKKVLAIDMYTGVYEESFLRKSNQRARFNETGTRNSRNDRTLHDRRCTVWVRD